ncbi:MAG TPA: hypothetical protein VLM89_15695 [Phycisphaerae bacterium]|nr:hypothetical protein [Phycisphaerae bacterium]
MALSSNREVDRYVDQELRSLPVKGGAHIRKGGFVGLSGGYARPLVAGDVFAGIAYEELNNTGVDGALAARVFTLGDFELALAGADRVNNRGPLFASDDETLTASASGNSFVGYQIDVPGTNRAVLRIQVTPTPLAGGTMTGELVSAGIRHKVATKASAANVAIGTNDLGGIIVITGTTAGNLNLPAAATAGAGAWCTFIKSGASGVLTIDPSGSETIDGAATNSEMDAANDSITIACNGTAWIVTGKKIA